MIAIKTLPAKLIICILALFFADVTLLAQDSDDSLYGKTVKEIRITGLHLTKRYIVTRELASQVGKPYLRENAEKDLMRLERLGLFSDIKICPIEEEDGVILIIELVEMFSWLPTISINIDDENGISAGGGFMVLNLLGKNIFFSGTMLFGGATTLGLLLENPWFAGNHMGYRFEYSHRERQNKLDDFYEKTDELYLTLSSYLGEKARIGGRFSYISLRSDLPGKTLSFDNHDKVARFGFYVAYDSRDYWTNTHRGWWNELELSREVRFLNSDSDYYQMTMDIRRYIPIMDRHTMAIFSITTLSTGTVGEDIAPWQDYHIGGTNTVRGWEIGSRVGKNQFINTLEYRITLIKPQLINLPFGINYSAGLQIAVFGDFGMVWNERNEFEIDNFIGGYGIGIRLLLPMIGMTRFDFGYGERGAKVKLCIGGREKPVMTRKRVR